MNNDNTTPNTEGYIATKEEAMLIIHQSSFRNYDRLKETSKCGCFHCMQIFPTSLIDDWCDEDGEGPATALCPFCGIDSIINGVSKCGNFPLNESILKMMHDHFFNG